MWRKFLTRQRTNPPWRTCAGSQLESYATSIGDSRVGVRVLEGGRARPPHELARSERLIFSVIAVDLPAAQTAAGIHNPPPITAKHLLHIRRLSLDNRPMAQTALSRLHRTRKAWDQS